MSYNTKIKIYNDGSYNVIYCNYPIFDRDMDRKKKEIKSDRVESQTINDDLHTDRNTNNARENISPRTDSLKRAKDKCFDIIYQNDFELFLTLTINPEAMDRNNPQEVIKKLNVWLRNRVQRKGLKYILVPEEHKNGGIHMHLLINDVFDLEDSGRRLFQGKAYKIETLQKKGIAYKGLKTIYNLPEWKYGFTTAIYLDGERGKIANYVTKYITKDIKHLFGKFFWSSKNIIRDTDIEYDNVEYSDINRKEYIPFGNTKFKYDLHTYSHSSNTDSCYTTEFEKYKSENGMQSTLENPISLDDMPIDIDYSNIPWE